MEIDDRMRFVKREGGFTTPAAALAILVACSLVFVCARGISIGSRSGQIQYVADAGALAADNVVAKFVTAGQVIDSTCVSLSLLGLTVYAASAVAAFIPGGQTAATEIAQIGSKILRARDDFAKSAIKGLEAAQKALPAICAVRAAQVIQENAKASGISYVGFALTSPLEGASIEIPDDARADEAVREIESDESSVQETTQHQQEAQKREDDAKRRAWLADCGDGDMSMYERAKRLSDLPSTRNPYCSSPERWSFSIALERAKAYYAARFATEPGAYASGSPMRIGQSVARKRFYAYAMDQVSKGYIDHAASGTELPHLVHLARNAQQIRETFLYTEAIYPVSQNDDGLYLHAYHGCPTYECGSPMGVAAVSSIDAGSLRSCPDCQFSAKTLGRVPSASTSIRNGFEYHYKALVDAANDYADAVHTGEQTKQKLNEVRKRIGMLLSDAVNSLAGARYDPQPPGRYGCICIVAAPSDKVGSIPFVQDDMKLPARIAVSGATLAPDAASEQGTIITDVAQGLIPANVLGSGVMKTVVGAWGDMLQSYNDGCANVKAGLRKTLSMIPLVGNTISNAAVSTFENALSAASLQPPDLAAYKPVLVNTSHILAKDDGKIATMLEKMKQAAQVYGAVYMHDLASLTNDIANLDYIAELLDERGLELARIPLGNLGLGSKDATLYLPVPEDLHARIEELCSSFESTLIG